MGGESQPAPVAFFDLDRTLIDCNSGRLWLVAEWRSGRIAARDLAWGAYWLGRYSVGLADGLDRVFETAALSIRGMSEAELAGRTERWFHREVRHRLRPGALRALGEHRARGDQLVVATSSSQFAGALAKQAFGLDDQVTTVFEAVDGVMTGRIAQQALGAAKADRVAEWAEARKIPLDRCAFYTDSATDLALLLRVGQPVAVNPDRELRRIALERRWPVVDWGRASG